MIDITSIHRTFILTITEYMFFTMPFEHFLGQIKCYATKQVLINLKRLKSYQTSFFKHSSIKLEANCKRKK